MIKKIKISLPLEVQVSKKKKFILNLNNYRNAHFRTLSAAKNLYHDIVIQTANKIPYIIKKCELAIVLYPKSKRKLDVANFCSICDKFASDSLTRLGYWSDDNYTVINAVKYIYGKVDKENPRFEYIIHVKKQAPLK